MKKLLLFASVATMFAACTTDTTEDVAVNCLPYDVLHVSVGDEDESRIQLDENCQTVWNEGDMISVFNKTNGNECWQFDGKTGDKRGTLSKISGNAGTTSTDKVVALYPYDSNCAISGNMISTTIPATQTYRADSFGEGGNIMVAVSNDNELQFKHIFGWIKLSLTDDLNRTVTSIAFSGNNNENLAGNAIIDASTPKTYINDNIKSLELICGDGVQLSADTPSYFYIAVLPQKFANGVSIDVTLTNNGNVSSLKKCYEDSFTVTRNHIQPIQATNFKSVNDKIIYTTLNHYQINLNTTKYFGTKFVSHTYKNEQGIIQFEGDIMSIPEQAFRNCETLKSILIPDSVTSIGEMAFAYCSRLTSVAVGSGVEVIGECAFRGCESLSSVFISDIAKWCAIEFNNISNPLYYAHKLYLNGELVTDLVIPDSITSIEDHAFEYCRSLKSITIPNGVVSIGDFAFTCCSGLKSITIGNSVTSIGRRAFAYCSNLTSINIPDSVTSIGDFAFDSCSGLKSVTIPDSVTEIGRAAFSVCSNLKSITIPNGVISIGDFAFDSCDSLTNITIPDSVTSIGKCAFRLCGILTSVTIGKSVATIGDAAFAYCSSLTNIYCKSIVPPALGYKAFIGISSSAKIYVPTASVDAYKSAEDWSVYADKIVGYDF